MAAAAAAAVQQQHIERWLLKHGVPVPVALSEQQKRDLQECFNFLDADGSGERRRGGTSAWA